MTAPIYIYNTTTTDITSTPTWSNITTDTLSDRWVIQPVLQIPSLFEFDSDYDKDTRDQEDPLNILKRVARGCYKGNSCIECNNERIAKEYNEKYPNFVPYSFTGNISVTLNYITNYSTNSIVYNYWVSNTVGDEKS